MNDALAEAIERRRRNDGLASLRKLATRGSAQPSPAEERCDLCGRGIPAEHRHLLNLYERQIVCSCETCWGLRSGDAELRPVGSRVIWLDGFELPEDVWASFGIPIGLAFFMYSSVTECVIALYPSPAGATESELHFSTWNALVDLNPVLADLEPDAEALIVNLMGDEPAYAIAPIDRCYMLVGLIKTNWQGISGGSGPAEAVARFFDELKAAA
jgi:hypothetical protein